VDNLGLKPNSVL